jgi:hypothetical protein
MEYMPPDEPEPDWLPEVPEPEWPPLEYMPPDVPEPDWLTPPPPPPPPESVSVPESDLPLPDWVSPDVDELEWLGVECVSPVCRMSRADGIDPPLSTVRSSNSSRIGRVCRS